MESIYVSLREASQSLGVSAEQLYRMGVAGQFRLYKHQPFHRKGGEGYEIVESLIFEEDVFDEVVEPDEDEDPDNMYYFNVYGELLLIRKIDFQTLAAMLPPSKIEVKPGVQIAPTVIGDDAEPDLIGQEEIMEWFRPVTWNTIKKWIKENGGTAPADGVGWTLERSLARTIKANKKSFIDLKRKK